MLLIEAFAELGQLFKESSFAQSGGQPITDSEVLDYVNGVVRSMIRDRNLSVVGVTVDGDTFKGEARVKTSLRLTKRFSFEISPDFKTFQSLNAEEIEKFAEPVEFRASGGKTLKCKIQQCGGRCLKGKEKCRITMNAEERKAHDKALRKVGTVETSLAKKRRETKEAKNANINPLASKNQQTGNRQNNDLKATSTDTASKKQPSKLLAIQDNNKIKSNFDSQWAKAVDDLSLSRISQEKFKDYKFVLNEITASEDKKYAIFDDKGNMQAVATWKKKNDCVSIGHLATAPWNISGDDPRSVKGAGTKAVVQAVKISQRLGFEGKIRLESADTAKAFYEKLGFKSPSKDVYVLSKKNAEELLKKHG
jgi:hypothetical protein